MLWKHVDLISNNNNITTETIKDSVDKKGEDITAFKELLGKFDLNTSVSLMLKLKKDFGSIDNVLDEYLCCLQIGINLEDYIKDKEEYQKQKKEKAAGLDSSKIITIKIIEEKKKENKANKENKA